MEWNIFLEQLWTMFFEAWSVAVGEVAKLGKRTYRNKIQITADILELAKQGSHKTRIMYLGNLSFDLVQKYLKQLEELGLVEVKGVGKGERIYNITPRGLSSCRTSMSCRNIQRLRVLRGKFWK